MTTYPALRFRNHSGAPRKQSYTRKKAWEPYIDAMKEMRSNVRNPKRIAKDIGKHLQQKGFRVNPATLRKKLREVAPLNNTKKSRQLPESPTLPANDIVNDTAIMKSIDDIGEGERIHNNVEMQDIPSENPHNNKQSRLADPVYMSPPTQVGVNISICGTSSQKQDLYRPTAEIDENVVTELLNDLNLISVVQTSHRNDSLADEIPIPVHNTAMEAAPSGMYFQDIAKNIMKQLSNTAEQSIETLSIKSYLHQHGYLFESLLKMAAEVAVYDANDTNELDYRQHFQEYIYIATSDNQQKKSAIRLHKLVRRLIVTKFKDQKTCGLDSIEKDIVEGTRADSAFRIYLQARVTLYWAEWRNYLGKLGEAIEMLFSAHKYFLEINSTRVWSCIIYITNLLAFQGRSSDAMMLAVIILSSTPRKPEDLWQSRVRIFAMHLIGVQLSRESSFDDAEALISGLRSSFLLNRKFSILNYANLFENCEKTLSRIFYRKGLHGSSLDILYRSYKSLVHLKGKEDFGTLYLLQRFGQQFLSIGRTEIAHRVYKYLFSFLTPAHPRFLRERSFFIMLYLGRTCSLLGYQIQALKMYERAAADFESVVARMLPKEVPLLEMWTSEAFHRRGLILYALPIAESATKRAERVHGIDGMKQWSIWETYLHQFRIDPLFASRAYRQSISEERGS